MIMWKNVLASSVVTIGHVLFIYPFIILITVFVLFVLFKNQFYNYDHI